MNYFLSLQYQLEYKACFAQSHPGIRSKLKLYTLLNAQNNKKAPNESAH
jgi:hypothetical protein